MTLRTPPGLPLRFSDLSISAPAGRASADELLVTVGSIVVDLALAGPLRRAWCQVWSRSRGGSGTRFVLKGVEGVVQQGEMLLVIGPPSAPTSLLLRALSSPSDLPLDASSQLDYGLLRPELAAISYLRSSIVYLSPHDAHFPSLTLSESLTPCARSKTPRGASESWASERLSSTLSSLSLAHATGTPFGSPLTGVHGLSGGEQKRASMAEALLTDAAVLLLDSPTSGLDSSTSLSLLAFLRATARRDLKSIVVSAPQVSNRLLEQFDKILVLSATGRQLFFGPRDRAVPYFESVGHGFSAGPTDETVSFLTECALRAGGALEQSWHTSEDRKLLLAEMEMYESRYPSSTCAAPYTASLMAQKSPWVFKHSRWTVAFGTQVALLTRRQYALVWAEAKTYGTKTVVNILLSALVGTLFWRLPPTTDAAFTRGSLLLLSIMFNAYLSLAELGKTLEGRAIVRRQSDYGFFGASALALARIAGDLPLIGAQVLLFGTVTYLSAGLQPSWERFTIYIVFVYATALNLSCLFRLFAALSPTFEIAMRFCGVALNILVILAGYFIPAPLLPAPLRFVHYFIDPISRAYEAVLTNEFHQLTLKCSPSQIVPSGPSYVDPFYQTCLLQGSTPHSLDVSGAAYLSAAYDFHYDHIWENLGIMALQALAFLAVSAFATEWLHFAPHGTTRIWARTKRVKKLWAKKWDKEEEGDVTEPLLASEESLGDIDGPETSALGEAEEEPFQMRGSVLVWKAVSLWVDTPDETRRLLDRVSGVIRPGRVCALLGASGAGKSTLLNVLAGRSKGVVRGAVLVDGLPPSAEFYRTTGFVDQFDLFDEKSTVRESLEFSALLRQDRSTPRAEQLAYVDVVLDLLDLTHIQDAIVGTPTAGLDLCSRKLLSIAVEVVARPTILFADEPTTSLDSKSALKVVKLLRRLARTGMSVIATIHQPSAESFMTFDDVLLLQRGGKQLYFGTRASSTTYFASVDTKVAIEYDNAADHLLDIAGSREEAMRDEADANGLPDNLAESWRQSKTAKDLQVLLDALSRAAVPPESPVGASSATRWRQCVELTKRVSKHYFRDVSFSYTKLFTSTVVPLVIGLSFFQMGRQRSIVSFQNRMFSVFLLLFVPVVWMNVSIFKVVQLRGLWHARELPSKIFGRTAFATSLLLSELPYSAVCATIYFALWYLLVGFPWRGPTIAYAFTLVQIFWVFQTTWALWIVSLSSSLGIIANLLPFFLVSMEAFNGSLMPYAQMPSYWRWLYWLSPFQWYVRGMLGVLLHDQPVECSASEIVQFGAPNGQTCGDYVSEYLRHHAGRLLDPGSTLICSFCQATVGDDWLELVNIRFEDRWLSMAILGGYTILNVLLFYLLIYFPPHLPDWIAARRSGKTAEQVAEERWDEELDEAERAGAGAETLAAGTRDAFT